MSVVSRRIMALKACMSAGTKRLFLIFSEGGGGGEGVYSILSKTKLLVMMSLKPIQKLLLLIQQQI